KIEDANNEIAKIEAPKPFPKTPEDINEVKKIAAEGFYLIMSSKSEEEANQRINDYIIAFMEYPYYIIYIQYWLNRKQCWLKGYSPNQQGMRLTNNFVESWHSILKGKFLSRSRMKRADNLIYILYYDVLDYYKTKDKMSSAQYNKPNITKASKGNKEIVNALTNEEIEKRVEIKESEIFVQSFAQEDVFYEIKKNGNTYSCNCKNYHPIKICTHVYIASRYISVHPIKEISKKRKAVITETVNKRQKVAQAMEINDEVRNYQNKFVTTIFKTSQEYEVNLSKTQEYSYPVTSLKYNYESTSTQSQVIPFSQPIIETDLPDINEPEEYIPVITVEEFQKHGFAALAKME
ncbi:hypothetical protein L150_06324, partial [Candida albicans Ca529L]